MNAGVAVAIGLFLLSRNSAASSSSGARPGSTAGNARQGSASKSGGSGGGFPSPFGAGAGRGGSNDMGDVIDFTDVVNQSSIFPSSSASDAELAPPDFSGVGSGVDQSSLTDLASAGLAPPPIFDPGNSNDFGLANDPGIDSGSGDFSGDMAEF